jgi:hypothetical protein
MHKTAKVTFSLYIVLIMDEIRAVVTISRDTQCDGGEGGKKKKRWIMCITQKDHYDIIAIRMPLLDQYLCSRLLRHADYLLTYLLSDCNSTHYFYKTNYFVLEKNRKRICLGFKSMHDAAKHCCPDFLFINPITYVFIFLRCHYSFPSTERDGRTDGRTDAYL